MQNLHVVLGSTGGAGNAIARALAEAGLRVRAVNRSGKADLPPEIELLAADITIDDGATAAVSGASVVYMAAQPPYHRWPEEFPPMLERVIAVTADVGAKLVMVDNLYGYGPDAGTMSEDTPERANDTKGEVRRRMTRMLLDAHESGRLRVTIGRASDYFGPRAENSGVTALSFQPIADGKRLRWLGNLDAPHSLAYLPDIGRAYVGLGTSDVADGRVWILPHHGPITGRDFLETINGQLPEPLPTGAVSKAMLRLAAPFHKISKETLGIAYQWTDPFVVDDSRFRAAFGSFETTSLDAAIATTVDWYKQVD
ncbi:MAG: NAD-dependent epimerase/dehydratase family protein [Acidimicrobiia bacterium]|nr:NAD-dependent epimerase/dehydratase family protein [Acidimicrobiia bacterium]